MKAIFELTITFNSKYKVLSNGILKNKQSTNNLTTWTYSMNQPMPSYLLALVVGDYTYTLEKAEAKVPLYNYYHKKDSMFVEPLTGIVRLFLIYWKAKLALLFLGNYTVKFQFMILCMQGWKIPH